MKTPVSPIWIPGLVVLVAWLPCISAQNETNEPTPKTELIESHGPATPAQIFPEITAPKDFPLAKPSVESDALVLKRQPPKIRLSPWTSEIVKLAESGIEDGVIFSFIENSGTFNLGADQIVYLNDLGLSSELITAMLRHDQEIVSGARPLTIASEPALESEYELKSAPNTALALKTIPTPIASTGSSLTTSDPTVIPSQETLLEINPALSTTQLATITPNSSNELPKVQTAVFSQPRELIGKKYNPYRVREPYPEEITAPIILFYGESRSPNTVVVVGFPRATP